MIDVHTHILPFIDDGAAHIEDSYAMLKKETEIGIRDIILTPHVLRYNFQKYTKEQLLSYFSDFYKKAKEKYDVNLYLGQEITYQDNMISLLKKDALFSVNQSPYILLELPFQKEVEDFDEVVFSSRVLGYTIIIAHPERYDCLNYEELITMRSHGVLFQVNSNSITGASGKTIQKRVLRMFKDGLVDLVGSDVHYFRPNDMDIAYAVISDKFGKKTADEVFELNARNFFHI